MAAQPEHIQCCLGRVKSILSELTLYCLKVVCVCQSHHSTYLHHSCRTDKGTSRHFRDQWRIPHTTARNQIFPSSSPCRVALLSSFHLQGALQDPAPRRELLVWPPSGSLNPLCSAQSSPWWWDHYRPVGSGSHSVLTACNGDDFKSLFLSGWGSHTEFGSWLNSFRTVCWHWMYRKSVERRRTQFIKKCYYTYLRAILKALLLCLGLM